MTESTPEILHILVIEDDPAARHLLRLLLDEQAESPWPLPPLETTWADRLSAARTALAAGPVDIILCDLALPDSLSEKTLSSVITCRPDVPVIVLTSLNDSQTIVDAMRLGAQDYLVKGQLTHDMLARSIRYALEHSKVGQQMRRSDEQIRLLAASMKDLFCTYDMNNQLQFISPSFEKVTGYSAQELREGGHGLCVDPRDRAQVCEMWADASAGVACLDQEFRMLTKSGATGWLSISWWPLFDEQGKQVGVAGQGVDITARKLAEDGLREQEERFHTLADLAPIGIYLTDAQGKCIFANQRWCAMAGLTLDEALGDGWVNGLHADDRARVWQDWDRLAASGGDWNLEYRFQSPGGKITWVCGLASRLQGADGQTSGYIGINVDITERKLAESALQAAEQKYQRLYAGIQDAFVGVDMDRRILEANPSFCTMLGYTEEELRHLSYLDFTPEKWHAFEERIIQEQVLVRGYSDVYEKEYRRKDGSVFATELRAFVVKDDAGQPSAMWAIVRDITERKRAEELTRYQASLVQAIRDAIISTDMNDNVVSWNDGAEAMYGWSASDVLGKPINDFLKTRYPQETRDAVIKKREADGYWRGEVIQYRKDGSPRNILSSVVELHDASGKTKELVAVNTDITESKQAQEALRVSEERFKAIASNTPDHILMQDRELRYSFVVNPQLGLTIESMLGKTDYDFLPKDEADQLTAIKKQVLETGKSVHVEPSLIARTGGVEVFDGSYVPLYDAQQKVSGLVGYFRNVTERKRMEHALQDSELRFRSLIEQAAVAISLSRNGVGLLGNKKLAETFGLSSVEEAVGRPVHLYFAPSVQDVSKERTRRWALGESIASEFESIGQRTDGSEFPMHVATSLIQLADGPAQLSFLTDITERRQAEEALLASEQASRRMARQLQVVNQIGIEIAAGLEFEQLMQTLYEQARQIGDTDTFYVAHYDDVAGVLTFPLFRTDGERRTIPAINITGRSGFVGYVIERRETIYIPDTSDPAHRIKRFHQQLGKPTRSFVGVPLFLKGRVVGVMSMQSHETNAYSSDQISTLEMLATQVAIAIQNSRLFEQVQSERNLANVLIDSMPGIVCLVNRQGKLVRWNRQAETIWADSAAADSERTFESLVAVDKRARMADVLERVFVDGQATAETELATKDGIGIPILVTGTRVQIAGEDHLLSVCIDITERKKAENALRESEMRFRTLSENALTGVYIIQDSHLVYVNAALAKMLGYSAEEIIGADTLFIVHPDDHALVIESVRRCTSGEDKTLQFEFRGLCQNGETLRFAVWGACVELSGQVSIIGNIIDVTDSKKATEKLNQSLAELQSLHRIAQNALETKIVAGVIQVVAQTIVDNLKYAHAAIIRYTEESRTGSAVAFYPPNERITALFTSLGLGVPTGQAKNNIVTLEPGVNALWDRIMQGQLVTSTSLADFCTPWLKRPIAEAVEERMGTCSYVACPMQVDGHMVGIIFAATRGSAATTEQQQSLMVTARQAALAMHYAELYDQVVAGRERQQALSRRLLEIQEDERRAIARELHDEIGQALTALKLNLRASVPSMDALKRAKHQEQAVAIVDNTLQQVRNLSRDLHPSILDDLGLAPALRWYIDLQMQSSGLSVMLKLDEVRTGPDAHVRITAFRIAQEALTNVLRHARAKTVEVELRERAGVIDLKIRDDGVGFDVEAARRDAAGGRSLGILSMQERADFVGGSFSIASAPGHGTEVRARFTSSDVAQASQ